MLLKSFNNVINNVYDYIIKKRLKNIIKTKFYTIIKNRYEHCFLKKCY